MRIQYRSAKDAKENNQIFAFFAHLTFFPIPKTQYDNSRRR
jgi:hypothetical protein